MKRFFRVQSPARLISLGFAVVILLGSALLMLPCSVRDGVELKYIDALYTSTSAVCVTGRIPPRSRLKFAWHGQNGKLSKALGMTTWWSTRMYMTVPGKF